MEILLPGLAFVSLILQQRAEQGALESSDILSLGIGTPLLQSGLQVLPRVDQRKEQWGRQERPRTVLTDTKDPSSGEEGIPVGS